MTLFLCLLSLCQGLVILFNDLLAAFVFFILGHRLCIIFAQSP